MKGWQQRFRAHMDRHHLSQEKLGSLLDPERSQATIGHWLRGIREINLGEFFALCEAAGADPHEILFGQSSAEAALSTLRATVLATKPDDQPGYEKYEKSMRSASKADSKSKKAVKAPVR